MKRIIAATSLISVLSVWVVLLPMWFIYSQFPPEKTLKSFERFGAKLPFASEFLLQHLTMGRFCFLALLFSVVIIWLGVKAAKTPKLLAGQTCIAGGWCSVVAAMLLCFFMPLFKMGEVVGGGGRVRAKSEFTQIEFIVDSLYSAPQQMFMQREGEHEIAIPREDGERWVNAEPASGTNKVFCMVYIDAPPPTNSPTEKSRYWWPCRVVELSLPMTNQPLADYTLRTLWTCNPKADMWRPYSIAPTWDGKYLMVYSTPYTTHTNTVWSKATTYIFDVEQCKVVNVPPAPQ